MILEKVTLRNFRSFKEIKVVLHPRLTVLVGENGAGKTALLDGIASALSPVLTHLSSADQRLSGRGFADSDFYISPKNIRSDFAYAKAEAIIDNAPLVWDTWRPAKNSKNKPENLIGQTELKNRLMDVTDSYREEIPQLTPVFAYYGAVRGHVDIPRRLRATQINYDYPAAALVDSLNATSHLREALAWFDQEESNALRARRDNVRTNSRTMLDKVRLTITDLLGKDKYHNPRFNNKHKFVITRKADNVDLLVEQLSQGYTSMLALAMDYSRRLSVANKHLESKNVFAQPSIMLIDEVDLHLHPCWQQSVLSDLMNVFPKTQFIVTTHSPQVLSTVKNENIRILSDGTARYIDDFIQPYGELSSNVLHTLMGVDPRPPIAEREELNRLNSLVDNGLYEEDEAKQLLEKLSKILGDNHEAIFHIKQNIKRQKLFASLKKG